MRSLRGPLSGPITFLPMVAGLLALVLKYGVYAMWRDPFAAWEYGLADLLVALMGFGIVAFTWFTLSAFGIVEPGSEGGLRLAALGLVALVQEAMFLCVAGVGEGSVLDTTSNVGRLFELVRCVAWGAYALGLGLVVAGSVGDILRRRARTRPRLARAGAADPRTPSSSVKPSAS